MLQQRLVFEWPWLVTGKALRQKGSRRTDSAHSGYELTTKVPRPPHYQDTARLGPCRKTRVVPHNRLLRPEPYGNESHKMHGLSGGSGWTATYWASRRSTKRRSPS